MTLFLDIRQTIDNCISKIDLICWIFSNAHFQICEITLDVDVKKMGGIVVVTSVNVRDIFFFVL